MAIAFLKHTPVGKSTQAQPYTAAAHMRYIMRKSHTNYVYSERMPVNWHAVQRYIKAREDRIRKNGRVVDKLTISLPREQSMEQNIEAVRDFGWRLTEGRAPFLFTIQDYGTDNPHVHFVFIDEDVETGEKVVQSSYKGSTDRIKGIWEDTCNDHLRENGIEAEIEFGRVQEVANDNLLEPDTERPQTPLAEPEPEQAQETELQPVEPPMNEAIVEYGTETLQGAIRSHEELTMLRAERARLEEYTRQAEWAREEATKAQELYEQAQVLSYGAANDATAAADALASYQRADGTLKGIHFKLWKFEYKSNTRINAETAQELYAHAEQVARSAEEARKEAELQRDMANAAIRLAEEKEYRVKHQLATRGTPEELNDVERTLEHTRDFYMEGVDLERVREAYKSGELTEAEYETALEIMAVEKEAALEDEKEKLYADREAEVKALAAELGREEEEGEEEGY